jgi:hypothetical protein
LKLFNDPALVEAIAKATCQGVFNDVDVWDALENGQKRQYERGAKAAITVMLEQIAKCTCYKDGEPGRTKECAEEFDRLRDLGLITEKK